VLETTYRYVYEVYRLKSVSAAAKSLFISQPALSAAIRKAGQNVTAQDLADMSPQQIQQLLQLQRKP